MSADFDRVGSPKSCTPHPGSDQVRSGVAYACQTRNAYRPRHTEYFVKTLKKLDLRIPLSERRKMDRTVRAK